MESFKRIKQLSLLLVALLLFTTSCSDDDDNNEPGYQGDLPAVEKTSIEVNEELEISYSSTIEDGFTYSVTEGDEFITVIEQDGTHYIQGVEPGEATLILTNYAGDATVTVTVDELSYEDNQGVIYNINLDDNTASVSGTSFNSIADFSSLDGIVTIPLNISYEGKEYPITSIGDNAFYNGEGNMTLKELRFSDGSLITSIGYEAFRDCQNLTTVDFNTLTELSFIGERSFSFCKGLKMLDFSNSSLLDTIGSNAFNSCSSLEEIDFSGCTSLTSIEQAVFAECSNLIDVDLSKCSILTLIDSGAFYNCNPEISVQLSLGVWHISGDYDNVTEINNDNWRETFIMEVATID